MDINIGDKVKFLTSVGGGTVSGFRKGGYILVEDEDGFEIPVRETEIVKTSHPPKGGDSMSSENKNNNDTVPKRVEYGIPPADANVPEDDYVKSLEKRIIRLEMMVHQLENRIERLESVKVQQKAEREKQNQRLAAAGKAKAERESKSADDILEVDLHIDQLLDNTTGMGAKDIKDYQIKVFKEVMEAHKGQKGKRIVFIHGNGDGVLRKSILTELKYSYKQCQWQDASFQQYGFGATMVII